METSVVLHVFEGMMAYRGAVLCNFTGITLWFNISDVRSSVFKNKEIGGSDKEEMGFSVKIATKVANNSTNN